MITQTFQTSSVNPAHQVIPAHSVNGAHRVIPGKTGISVFFPSLPSLTKNAQPRFHG